MALFRFKQFSIAQYRSALKVNTESCVFGALLQFHLHEKNILDVGTGNGVLALMAAQKHPHIYITGIENHEGSYLDAITNFSHSPFHARLHCQFKDFFEYEPETFPDHIISNPPFFTDAMQASHAAARAAKHIRSDFINRFFDKAHTLLMPGKKLTLWLPTESLHLWEQVAHMYGFKRTTCTLVSQKNLTAPYRVAITWCKHYATGPLDEQILYLFDSNTGKLTSKTADLLKPYYLFL